MICYPPLKRKILFGITIWAQSFHPSVFASVCPRFVRPDEYRHFCLLKLTKYFKMLPFQMNISNTNEHFFPILYTCINYKPPMNPVEFCPDKIHNSRLFAIFVCSNWQNIWKYCPSRWTSPAPMNISSRFSTHALTTILLWILWSFVRIKFIIAD